MFWKISFRIDITLFFKFNEIKIESEVFTSTTTTMIILTRRTFRSATFNCYYSTVVKNSDIEELLVTVVDDNHEIERCVYQLMTRARKWYHQSRQSKSFLSVVSGFVDEDRIESTLFYSRIRSNLLYFILKYSMHSHRHSKVTVLTIAIFDSINM
jgi:hypothetical protein